MEWKKREGDWVEKGEILFVFETEKVTFDVEAPESGFLARILPRKMRSFRSESRRAACQGKGEQVELAAEKRETVLEDMTNEPRRSDP